MTMRDEPEWQARFNALDDAIGALVEYTRDYAARGADEAEEVGAPVGSESGMISGWTLAICLTYADPEDDDLVDRLIAYNSKALNHYQNMGMARELANQLEFGNGDDE